MRDPRHASNMPGVSSHQCERAAPMDDDHLTQIVSPVATGIVYVLINPAMPGYVKIGKTTDLVRRIAQLNNEAVPEPFICVYAAHVVDRHKVERVLHTIFESHRSTKDREFFRINPEDARQVLALMSHDDVTGSAAPNGARSRVNEKPPARLFSVAHMSPLIQANDEDRIVRALTDNGGSFPSQAALSQAMNLSKAEVSRMLRNCSKDRIERVRDYQSKCNVVRLKAV